MSNFMSISESYIKKLTRLKYLTLTTKPKRLSLSRLLTPADILAAIPDGEQRILADGLDTDYVH